MMNRPINDLTEGRIVNHIFTLAAPVAIGLMTQTAYQLIDLYFVTRIGVAAIAGVNAAGTLMLVVVALMQILGIGTVALIANAAGRKDQGDANLIFNQSIVLSAACSVITLISLNLLAFPYLRSLAADAATIDAGVTFIIWVLPGFVFCIPMAVLSSALRGIGIVRPTIAFYVLTVVLNAILAPILIAGWGTGAALGVKGAGLATTISVVLGTLVLGFYFHRAQHYMTVKWCLLSPQFDQWRRILAVGLPVGGEFALGFFSIAAVYYALRDFGASAQAGYGIGLRVIQTVLLPGLSIAFAAGPIIGQNFGAKKNDRVIETFRKTLLLGTVVMITTVIVVQLQSKALVGMFGADASASAVAVLFLQLISWALIAQGLILTCKSVFQGFGNTMPTLISGTACFCVFVIPLLWLSVRPTFRIEQVWYLYVMALTVQAIVSVWLLRAEFRRRLLPVSA